MSRVSNGERFSYRLLLFAGLLVGLLSNRLPADTMFLEAETMQPSSAGWEVTDNDQTQRASRTTTLWGADGPGDAVATAAVRLGEAGRYRVWVRYLQVAAWRGPFELAIGAGGKRLAAKVFDCDPIPGIPDWEYTWQALDAELPAGEITLSLAKHEQKNCVGYVRHVDCLLLTTDDKLVPDHVPYGPQTLLRVTIGEGYDRPVYLHVFADHYRSPNAAGSLAPADSEFLTRSYNPWRYPAGIRDRLLTPVRDARITPSLTCDTPLVDAVELRCDQGILIALANHTLQPLARIGLQLNSAGAVRRVDSVRVGPIAFESLAAGTIRFAVPLDASDFIMVSTK